MANVHGIGDVRAPPGGYSQVNQQNQPQQQPLPPMGQQPQPGQQQQQQQQQGGAVMMPAGDEPIHPKLGSILAPKFKKGSFIFVMIVLQILMFIATLFVGQFKCDGTAFVLSNSMAGPGAATLREVGAKYVLDIQAGQVFRFITPVFLHGGILHLFFNGYFELAVGCRYEAEWGIKRMMGLFFITGYGATLLSCVGAKDSVSVGASGALFGILGAAVAYVALNWSHMVDAKQRMCNLVMMIIINFLLGLGWADANIDNYAHAGGLLAGLLMGTIFVKSVGANLPARYKLFRMIAVLLSAGYFIGFTLWTLLGLSVSKIAGEALSLPCRS